MITRLHTISSFLSLRTLVYGLFLTLHLLLFNYNVAEWGDSYRILRAAEALRDGYYPSDEKRPPLYSLLLASRPQTLDPVTYGRVVMFVVSLLTLLIFDKLAGFYISDAKNRALALAFLAFNPVFMYWSLRIMADVFFAFLVLFSLWLYVRSINAASHRQQILKLASGLVVSLAILTRFEGYLLAVSFGLFFLVESYRRRKVQWLASWWVVGVLVGWLPYIYFRNPLTSSYLEEPAGRAYDLQMVWIYLVSLLGLFGFLPIWGYIASFFTSFRSIRNLFPRDEKLLFWIFIVLELMLILAWPAAVPRLFVPIIPLVILLFFISYSRTPVTSGSVGLVAMFITLFVAGSQLMLKLQFLLPTKLSFVVVYGMQFLLVATLVLLRKKAIPVFLAVSSMILWAIFSIQLHRYVFISVKHAAEYAAHNLEGKVGYNDVSSVSDWYLNVYEFPGKRVSGVYYNTDSKKNLSLEELQKKELDYLLITNEHNTDTELDISKRQYLEEVADFRYNVNGKEFFAKLVRIIYSETEGPK